MGGVLGSLDHNLRQLCSGNARKSYQEARTENRSQSRQPAHLGSLREKPRAVCDWLALWGHKPLIFSIPYSLCPLMNLCYHPSFCSQISLGKLRRVKFCFWVTQLVHSTEELELLPSPQDTILKPICTWAPHSLSCLLPKAEITVFQKGRRGLTLPASQSHSSN